MWCGSCCWRPSPHDGPRAGARGRRLPRPTIAALLASVPVTPVVVGIDIPIGLPDAGPRQADVLARRQLPVLRKSSVFPTPVRAAVSAATWQEANQANRRATGKGLSHQGFNLCRKIAEVDAWVRGGPGVTVLEVHPEVSLAAMGADTVPSKKRLEGRAIRVAALEDAGLRLPDLARTSPPSTCEAERISSATARLLTNLDVRDRVQLTVLAYESGWVVPGA